MEMKRTTMRSMMQLLIPLMYSTDQRLTIVKQALEGSPLLHEINFRGDSRVFTINLVLTVGERAPHSLPTLLNKSRPFAKDDAKIQHKIDELLETTQEDLKFIPQTELTELTPEERIPAETRLEIHIVPTETNIRAITDRLQYLVDAEQGEIVLSGIEERDGVTNILIELAERRARRLAFIAQYYAELLVPYGIRRIQFSQGATLLIQRDWKLYDQDELSAITGFPLQHIQKLTEWNIIPSQLVEKNRGTTTGRLSLKRRRSNASTSPYLYRPGAVNWLYLIGRLLKMSSKLDMRWMSDLVEMSIKQFDGSVVSAYLTLNRAAQNVVSTDDLQEEFDKLASETDALTEHPDSA